jgi:hypothetical protein
MTIFMLIIVTFLVYLCTMIWATLKDRKDLNSVMFLIFLIGHGITRAK